MAAHLGRPKGEAKPELSLAPVAERLSELLGTSVVLTDAPTGAGTTAAGLRAGVPSVVIPFFGDQPFWGRRVAELGVGPAPIPRRKLTAVYTSA